MSEYVDAPYTLAAYELPPALGSPSALTTRRWSDRGYMSRTTDTPASALYAPRILGDLEVGQAVFDRLTVGGAVGLSASAVNLANHDRALDDMIRRGLADGRNVTIKTAAIADFASSDGGTALANAATVFKGTAAAWPGRGLRAQLALGDWTERLNVRMQVALYDGRGGRGGAANLANAPMPIAIGALFNLQPVYIGDVDLGDGALPTFQTHSRQIDRHEAVRERGVPRTQVSDRAPDDGEWRDWPQYGMFQTGFTPDGLEGGIRCDVRGDAPGGFGGEYVDTHAEIVLRGLTAFGPQMTSSDFDLAAFSLAAFDTPGRAGWAVGAGEISARTAADQVLASCAAWLTGSRAGPLRMSALKSPASEMSFALLEHEIIDCEQLPLPAELAPAPDTIATISLRNWSPLADISSSITGEDRARLAGPGTPAIAVSDLVRLRGTGSRVWQLPGLYRDDGGFAAARVGVLKTLVERGLRLFRVRTDRYLGQMEIGTTGAITYADEGLGAWPGLCVGWRERVGLRRLDLFMLG